MHLLQQSVPASGLLMVNFRSHRQCRFTHTAKLWTKHKLSIRRKQWEQKWYRVPCEWQAKQMWVSLDISTSHPQTKRRWEIQVKPRTSFSLQAKFQFRFNKLISNEEGNKKTRIFSPNDLFLLIRPLSSSEIQKTVNEKSCVAYCDRTVWLKPSLSQLFRVYKSMWVPLNEKETFSHIFSTDNKRRAKEKLDKLLRNSQTRSNVLMMQSSQSKRSKHSLSASCSFFDGL